MFLITKNIFKLIEENYNSLSKTNKVIADYLKDNYKNIPFLSVKELSENIAVSSASITRFTQKLGYSGYPELIKEIQEILKDEIKPMRETKKFIASTNETENVLFRTIQENKEILNTTYTDQLNESFKKAIDLIRKSKKIYIIGSRSSYTIAYYLHFMLRHFMDGVVLLSAGTEDIYDQIVNLDKDDVLVAISFSRYTKLTNSIVDYFRKKGNKIISLTDSHASPIAQKADSLLIAKSSATTYSFVSAMTIMNALVISLGIKDKANTLERMKESERILFEKGIYM